MSDPDLTLAILRDIRRKLDHGFAQSKADLAALNARMSVLEQRFDVLSDTVNSFGDDHRTLIGYVKKQLVLAIKTLDLRVSKLERKSG
ncbi:MAG TPA: hypothetical protein VMZ53_22050 [Kofleriaceae bacterium]|nr:hypothetical protein [Kofleriaceae bacterium]